MEPAIYRCECAALNASYCCDTPLVCAAHSPIECLPIEIFLKILSFILTDDLIPVGRVCKYHVNRNVHLCERYWKELTFKEVFDRGMYNMEVLQVQTSRFFAL